MSEVLDTKTILESQAFRAINLMIDQRVAALLRWHKIIEDKMQMILSPPHRGYTGITVRTAEEHNGQAPKLVGLKFRRGELNELSACFASAEHEERMISELMQFKLRLQNDPDFSSRDNADQLAVFGISS